MDDAEWTDLISAQALLDALDGVAYLAALEGTILACGARRWNMFAGENHASAELTASAVVGRCLFDFFDGAEVRESQQRLHKLIVTRQRSFLAYEYRCDAPAIRREMRLSISPVEVQGLLVALLYQSTLLRAQPRPSISLFERPAAAEDASLPQLAMCSYCHNVRIPPDAGDGEWVSPEQYYRRGGGENVRLSHTICPDCYTRIVAPLLDETAAP